MSPWPQFFAIHGTPLLLDLLPSREALWPPSLPAQPPHAQTASKSKQIAESKQTAM